MIMLAFSPSTSSATSDLLFPVLAHLDVHPAKNCYVADDDDMFPTSRSATHDDYSTSSDIDDSGFFEDSEFADSKWIAVEIADKLTSMCDDFDAELESFRSHRACRSRSLLARLVDFFAF